MMQHNTDPYGIAATKKVSYHNHQLDVPLDTKYIATNADGEIYAFPTKPKFSVAGWDGFISTMVGSLSDQNEISIDAARESLAEYEYSISLSESYEKMQPQEIGYYGFKLTLPRQLAWVATDRNGDIYAYSREPKWNESHRCWDAEDADLYCIFVGDLNTAAHAIDARHSLIYYGEDHD